MILECTSSASVPSCKKYMEFERIRSECTNGTLSIFKVFTEQPAGKLRPITPCHVLSICHARTCNLPEHVGLPKKFHLRSTPYS